MDVRSILRLGRSEQAGEHELRAFAEFVWSLPSCKISVFLRAESDLSATRTLSLLHPLDGVPILGTMVIQKPIIFSQGAPRELYKVLTIITPTHPCVRTSVVVARFEIQLREERLERQEEEQRQDLEYVGLPRLERLQSAGGMGQGPEGRARVPRDHSSLSISIHVP